MREGGYLHDYKNLVWFSMKIFDFASYFVLFFIPLFFH
jgi:hypothetical protein